MNIKYGVLAKRHVNLTYNVGDSENFPLLSEGRCTVAGELEQRKTRAVAANGEHEA